MRYAIYHYAISLLFIPLFLYYINLKKKRNLLLFNFFNYIILGFVS